uniref:MD-2-related lipid-recognition domain-containing protein n=1 Tax=Arcella intermedia TaxID=1963864 RepID=A0A6B2LMM7_9EUKA
MALNIQPDPVVLGGNITAYAAVTVGQPLTSTGGKISLTIEKNTLGVWIEVPCIDGVGSCDYAAADLCTRLADAAKDPNTLAILKKYNLPVACPVAAGNYQIPSSDPLNVHVKNPNLSWLTNGDFYLKADAFDANGNENGCLEVYVSLTT